MIDLIIEILSYRPQVTDVKKQWPSRVWLCILSGSGCDCGEGTDLHAF